MFSHKHLFIVHKFVDFLYYITINGSVAPARFSFRACSWIMAFFLFLVCQLFPDCNLGVEAMASTGPPLPVPHIRTVTLHVCIINIFHAWCFHLWTFVGDGNFRFTMKEVWITIVVHSLFVDWNLKFILYLRTKFLYCMFCNIYITYLDKVVKFVLFILLVTGF